MPVKTMRIIGSCIFFDINLFALFKLHANAPPTTPKIIPNKTSWIRNIPDKEKSYARAKVNFVNPNAFDGRGNYALGLKEQIIFPEIEYDKIDQVRGMDVIFVTTAKTDEEARELLKLLGMPFSK